MRSEVVLPQPDGPTRTMNSPSSICRFRSLTATTSPYFFQTWSNVTVAMGTEPPQAPDDGIADPCICRHEVGWTGPVRDTGSVRACYRSAAVCQRPAGLPAGGCLAIVRGPRPAARSTLVLETAIDDLPRRRRAGRQMQRPHEGQAAALMGPLEAVLGDGDGLDGRPPDVGGRGDARGDRDADRVVADSRWPCASRSSPVESKRDPLVAQVEPRGRIAAAAQHRQRPAETRSGRRWRVAPVLRATTSQRDARLASRSPSNRNVFSMVRARTRPAVGDRRPARTSWTSSAVACPTSNAPSTKSPSSAAVASLKVARPWHPGPGCGRVRSAARGGRSAGAPRGPARAP